MPVAVICPSCQAKLKAPDGLIGKTVKCPGCANPVFVKAVAVTAAPAPAGVATAPRPAAKKPRPPEPEVLGEEPIDEEVVEARPKKRKSEEDWDERDDPSDNERTTAMLLHLLTFLIGFIIPVILWAVKRKESRFIDHHGKTLLNFCINMIVVSFGLMMVFGALAAVGYLISGWITAIFIGLFFLCSLALTIYSYVMLILATVKAKQGEWFEYRCLFRLLK